MLKVENLNIKLGDFSLKDASFEVKKGDYFMVLGESGAGKSILLECLVPCFRSRFLLDDINVSVLRIWCIGCPA